MTRLSRTKDSKTVQVSEIHNQICREGIELYDKMVSAFVAELNKFLPAEFQLKAEERLFEIRVDYDSQGEYENDGNTSCPGNKYRVLWAYSMFPVDNLNSHFIREGWTQGVLTFSLEFSERISDGRSRSRFFQSYVYGLQTERDDDRPMERPFLINNNYPDGVANPASMVQTIQLLRSMIETYKLYVDVQKVDFSSFALKTSHFTY